MSKLPRPGRRAALVGGAVLILGGFGYLLYGGIGENLVYFLTPSELLARGPSAYDSPLRLGGQVVPGSVNWDAEQLDLRFRLSDGSREVVVHSKGAPPQMFRDSMGVIVEGRYTRAAVFESHNLMVKHSNEYRPPPGGEHPAAYYREMFKGQKS
ncbi:MAG: cytochrome c maturation protein CcmE [Gemmatimonadetes bacterium]|nr:cytochrome c maturation protein CcmE [Gemmatimonadota bacterium]